MATPTVLVVGATGTLGSKIVSSLIQIGTANVKALVRPGKADQAQAFQEMGVIPVEGDLLDSSTLPQACQDVDAIIAAVALSDRTIVIEGQPPKSYMYLQYYWVMFSGKGKLEPLDNQRYPDVQTTSVEDFFKSGLHQPVAAR